MNRLFQRINDWYILGPREFYRQFMCDKGFDPLTDERVERAEERRRGRMRREFDRVAGAYSK